MPRIRPRTSCPPPARCALLRPAAARRACASTPACAAATRITPHYDPMIAKVIARGAGPRARRWSGWRAALADTQVGGHHDQPRLPAPPGRASGDAWRPNSTPASSRATRRTLIPPPREAPRAGARRLRRRLPGAPAPGRGAAPRPGMPCAGFRLFGAGEQLLLLRDEARLRRVAGAPAARRHARSSSMAARPSRVAADLVGRPARRDRRRLAPRARSPLDDDVVALTFGGEDYDLRLVDPYAPRGRRGGGGRPALPRPSRAASCRCWSRSATASRAARCVAILEAMKTELRITAPADGIVAHLGCAAGRQRRGRHRDRHPRAAGRGRIASLIGWRSSRPVRRSAQPRWMAGGMAA